MNIWDLKNDLKQMFLNAEVFAASPTLLERVHTELEYWTKDIKQSGLDFTEPFVKYCMCLLVS